MYDHMENVIICLNLICGQFIQSYVILKLVDQKSVEKGTMHNNIIDIPICQNLTCGFLGALTYYIISFLKSQNGYLWPEASTYRCGQRQQHFQSRRVGKNMIM